MSVSRRQFLGTAALGGLAAHAANASDGGKLPTRTLGRTGERVSILAFGGGSRFLMYQEEDRALAALNRALDLGITYIDTSDDYGPGRSEQRIGKVLKARGRQGVFLATKLSNRDGSQAERIVETSLKNLQVDRIDLVHIHQLMNEDDLARIEAKGGVLEQLQRMRDRKLIRFIGITSHYDPTSLRAALERHDFDCTQMALNAALVGMKSGKGGMVPNEAIKTSFETIALPVARRKKMGVLAMKIFAQEALVRDASAEKLLYYSLSLPGVTAAVVGMPQLEHIEENTRLARAFKPLPAAEMKQLSSSLAARHKVALDRFFAHHLDA